MTIPMNAVSKTVELLLRTESHRATKYLTPNLVVRATRIKNRHQVIILLTIGRPNYLGRVFVKNCQKAGETFPVKKVQLAAFKKSR